MKKKPFFCPSCFCQNLRPWPALALGATLVSRDTDFWQIDGLNIADWTV